MGAVNDIVKDIKAGLNLEMPYVGEFSANQIIEAVKNGKLSEERLNEVVEQLLNVILKSRELKKDKKAFDRKKDHEIARKIASEGMILLKNKGSLPLKRSENILFVGEFAERPRYQGGGGVHISTLFM